MSLGLRFDRGGNLNSNDPIPFIRFGKGDPSDDKNLIARMPISTASLTEVRGMAAEYLWIIRECKKFGVDTPADPERFAKEYAAQFYKDDFLVYTTGLHVLANHCGATTVTEILEYAANLAWVALNFPQSLVGRLRIPDDWQWGADDQETFNSRSFSLILRRDPGFIFCVLTKFTRLPCGMDCASWINELFLAAGDFTLLDFEQAWLEELEKTSSQAISDLPDRQFMAWMNVGEQWARQIGPSGRADELLLALDGNSKLGLPDALNQDWEVWNPGMSIDLDDGMTTLDRVKDMETLRDRMLEFIEACGV